jgi:hypothetical protein
VAGYDAPAVAIQNSPFPKAEKRTPFPRRSLPQAGDSLQEQVIGLFFGGPFFWGTVGATLALVALIGWIAHWMHAPLSRWFWTICAVAMGLMTVWQFFWTKGPLTNLEQAIRGERHVARFLEEFRANGYITFHDIAGDGFNIDHALVGPGGVFAIETKHISKRPGPHAKIDYDGKRVLVDGLAPDRDPIAQAEMNADHIRTLLKNMADRDVFVRPVVLYPGWFITRPPPDTRVWVLNLKAFASFLENERPKLPARISRFCPTG